MSTFWVSFANEDKFLGVAIVDVDGRAKLPEAVVLKTIELGCNAGPDTAVQVQKIPDEIPEHFKNRLLTKDEVALLNVGGRTN